VDINTSFLFISVVVLLAYRRNIVKISLFYGDIKFSTFTQYDAYDVPTLLGKTVLIPYNHGATAVLSRFLCSQLLRC